MCGFNSQQPIFDTLVMVLLWNGETKKGAYLRGHDASACSSGFGSLYSIELYDGELRATRLQAQCGLSVSRRVSMSRKGAEWREGVSARLISELYRDFI
jgi:hypothetical protein